MRSGLPPLCTRNSRICVCVDPSTPDECGNRSCGPCSISNCTEAATSSCWRSVSVSHQTRNSLVNSTLHGIANDMPSTEFFQSRERSHCHALHPAATVRTVHDPSLSWDGTQRASPVEKTKYTASLRVL